MVTKNLVSNSVCSFWSFLVYFGAIKPLLSKYHHYQYLYTRNHFNSHFLDLSGFVIGFQSARRLAIVDFYRPYALIATLKYFKYPGLFAFFYFIENL